MFTHWLLYVNLLNMADQIKKDSTNDLPMYDLFEAIKLAVFIHDKALETASLPDVAKGCGYANPTSTPFYRRLVAARLFKLLGSPKPELTKLALDYLKPETDDAKQAALSQAIMGIKTYADIVNLNVGKKLNTDLLANKLEKDTALSITKACAKTCASVFISSIKFAGFISQDGTVVLPQGTVANASTSSAETPPAKPLPKVDELVNDDEAQVQTLYLDNKRKRRITIKAPFTVTKEELERIRAWLGFQLIIEEPNLGPDQK
jgi:hypothetical protein